MNNDSTYVTNIRARTKFKYIIGLYPRLKAYIKYSLISWIARRNGAIVGKSVSMPYKLAKNANSNLSIGNNTSIQSPSIDLRAKVKIGSHVIIGSEVDIITCSHNIDSFDWEHKTYGIEIEDYCWLATKAFILPSCRKISRGAVCSAGAVVFRNVESMSIVSGNPAIHLKFRAKIHTNFCVENLRGNDLLAYVKAYKNK